MNSQNKNLLWAVIMTAFYIVTAFLGIYSISAVYLWPLLAVPMSIYIIKVGDIEIGALIGAILSVVISMIETRSFNPEIVIIFLLFIVLPSLVFGMLYRQMVKIPWIIVLTTITILISSIVLIVFNKLMGIDYITMYFNALDSLKLILQETLIKNVGGTVDESIINTNKQTIAYAILTAKRTYPAILFILSLIFSTLHLLLVQFIGLIMSWDRPMMEDILKTGLSQAAAWSLVILMLISYQVGNNGTIVAFAVENMMSVLFFLFQIIGTISIVELLKRTDMNKAIKFLIIILALMWFFINPVVLVVIGCFDVIFDFRKVETLI